MLSNRHLMFRHPLLKFSGFAGMQECTSGIATDNDATTHCIDGWLQFSAGEMIRNEA